MHSIFPYTCCPVFDFDLLFSVVNASVTACVRLQLGYVVYLCMGALLAMAPPCWAFSSLSLNHALRAMSEHLSIPMGILVPSTSTEISQGAGGQDAQRQNDSTNQESGLLDKTPTPM
jgi:hypothetical protein